MPTRPPARRVAVIGAGPAGAIAVDALARENIFTTIRVFERHPAPGGCWLGNPDSPHPPLRPRTLAALAARTADPPLPSIPAGPFPLRTAEGKRNDEERFAESSIYPYLETNVDAAAMCFTGGDEEDIPATRSEWSVGVHGADSPFRHWTVMREYVAGLFRRRGYEGAFVRYGACVERVVKDQATGEWVVTVRRSEGGGEDVWEEERFDGVVVASGHFNVPWIPAVEGLEEFEAARRGSVLHSKMFRGGDAFRGKRVVVVGASVSGADIAFDLATHRTTKDSLVHAVVIGHTFNTFFGDGAFQHPRIRQHPSIARVDAATRAVHLIDGTTIPDVDHLIFATGYSWSLPFLAEAGVRTRNNRVPGLFRHVVWREDPSLLFVGAVGAGLTFKIFEWQAVYAARILAGRGTVPEEREMREWEEARVAEVGDGPRFQNVHPEFEEYFEALRELAGPPTESGEGRALPRFEEGWFAAFMEGHERRKEMWRRENALARREVEEEEVKGSLDGRAQSRI